MANLDTVSKRASSVSLLSAWLLAPPIPDATLDQGDRQAIAYSYSGILAGAAAVVMLVRRVIGTHRNGERSVDVEA